MNNDLDLLEEALDLETAHRQMELAEMGYNDAVETESNKTREMHELKPASWWAQTFNTDGELRRREEGTKISMALNTAKRQKETFSTWQIALSPSAEKFKNGPYAKIIRELKKVYQGVSGASPSAVRAQAIDGALDERNALIWAYSSKSKHAQFTSLQKSGASASSQRLENIKQLEGLQKPSLFAQIFNTPANKQYVQQKDALLKDQSHLKEKYKNIQKEREPLRSDATQYVMYAAPLIPLLAAKHQDIKYAPLGEQTDVHHNHSSAPKKSASLKTGPELWGIDPRTNAPYNDPASGHPYALDSMIQPPKPKTL